MQLSTVKIEITEEELGLIREAIACLEEIDDRCDYGSCFSDQLYEDYRSIAEHIGKMWIKRLQKTPF